MTIGIYAYRRRRWRLECRVDLAIASRVLAAYRASNPRTDFKLR